MFRYVGAFQLFKNARALQLFKNAHALQLFKNASALQFFAYGRGLARRSTGADAGDVTVSSGNLGATAGTNAGGIKIVSGIIRCSRELHHSNATTIITAITQIITRVFIFILSKYKK